MRQGTSVYTIVGHRADFTGVAGDKLEIVDRIRHNNKGNSKVVIVLAIHGNVQRVLFSIQQVGPSAGFLVDYTGVLEENFILKKPLQVRWVAL